MARLLDVRKRKVLTCPYCGSLKVNSIGRSVGKVWTFSCQECKKESEYTLIKVAGVLIEYRLQKRNEA
jgi:transposase-like protein